VYLSQKCIYKRDNTMTQDVPKLRQNERIAYIEANLIFQTQEEMAKELGISRKTINRDLERWRNRGGLKRFLLKEFFELYGKEKIRDTSKALDRIVTLLTREIVKEDDQTKQVNKVVVEVIDPDPKNTNQVQTP
jgi:DNA-binding Lrp family transcriptional regulator